MAFSKWCAHKTTGGAGLVDGVVEETDTAPAVAGLFTGRCVAGYVDVVAKAVEAAGGIF